MRKFVSVSLLSFPLSFLPTNLLLANFNEFTNYEVVEDETNKDSVRLTKHSYFADSTFYMKQTDELKLNDDAIKLIQFDFAPSPQHQDLKLQDVPIKKSWMEFQVDLSVPKNMIDTTKIRKPERYIRMLPYSIWTRFGEDPVFDVLVFGNKKRFDITWSLDLDDVEEFGRNLMPNAGRYNPNRTTGNASCVIGNLDFIGFLYNNLNKQGRIRKHNKKYATAWKTYNKVAPALSNELTALNDSINKSTDYYFEGQPGLYHNLRSIDIIEERTPKYFEHPDYRLLQTPEQRSRFGTFYDPELYAQPLDDSINIDSLNTTNSKIDSNQNTKSNLSSIKQDKDKISKSRKLKTRKKSKGKDEDGVLTELPNSMEELYQYIRTKQQQDSIQRKEIFRKDKTDQNVYELEQQQRKLKERQN